MFRPGFFPNPRRPLMLVPLLLCACSSIWNASDLAEWVRDRAVEQGCQRETIHLDEWYTETAEGNVWRGSCRDAQGNTKTFGIDVDPVWKPSQSTNRHKGLPG